MKHSERIKIAGIKTRYTRKAELVKLLEDFYNNHQNIIDTWKALPSYDKEIITSILQGNGHIDHEELNQIAERVSEDNSITYKLSFSTIIKALDNHIPISKIIIYLCEATNYEVPEKTLFLATLKRKENNGVSALIVFIFCFFPYCKVFKKMGLVYITFFKKIFGVFLSLFYNSQYNLVCNLAHIQHIQCYL